MDNHSIVHWYPELEKHRCGYCKQLNTNCSYGMWAELLTVEDYQNLIDRGWRRSGKYCYKPVMDITCCPLYTIKCEVLNFKLSKSQKKILKKVNKFLSQTELKKDLTQEEFNENCDMEMPNEVMNVEKPKLDIDISKFDTSNFVNIPSNQSCSSKETKNKSVNEQTTSHTKPKSNCSINELKNVKPGIGADPSKPPAKKAKLIRLEKRQQKLAAKGAEANQSSSNPNQGKSLEDFIKEIGENPPHQLKIRLVRTGGSSRYWDQIKADEYPVYKKYQMLVHNDPPEKCSERQFTNFLFESPLQIILKRMDVTDPTYLESAELYEKYQMIIHNDDEDECDIDTFTDFLVTTPLKHYNPPDGPPNGYGSFHQQYWLEDKLIAVGVIDILPSCVSSVYFFYDPDYRHLTLGTYGSLREVEFTRQLNQTVQDLKYYYMGFYIHSCPKMRYKANLTPSYLLCPETYQWFPIEKCTPLLEVKPYSRFNENPNVLDENPNALDENHCEQNDIDSILILLNYKTCVPYRFFRTKIRGKDEEFKNFANLVGKKCCTKLLLILRDSDFS